MILREYGRFQVSALEGTPSQELDAPQQQPRQVEDVDRARYGSAQLTHPHERRAKLQIVRAPVLNLRRRPRFNPLRASRIPVLSAEIVPAASNWCTHHVAIPLRADCAVKPLDRERAIQRSSPQSLL